MKTTRQGKPKVGISLRVKAMTFAAVVLASTTAVIGVMVQRIAHEEVTRSHMARVNVTLEQLEEAVCEVLQAGGEPDAVNRLLRSAVQVDGVALCRAFGPDGKLLSYARAFTFAGNIPGTELLHSNLPEHTVMTTVDGPVQMLQREVLRRNNAELLGSLQLFYTQTPVTEAFAVVQRRIWFAVAAVGALSVLVMWVATHSLIRPIYQLVRGTQRITKGDYEARVRVSTKDELRLLGDSFNRMTGELAESRRKIEQHQHDLELTVQRRTAKLRKAYQELQVLDSMKDGFLSSISHEFRTPLTSIKAFAEILLSADDADDEDRREFLGIILKESDRLSSLVNDLLDLVKIENGEMPFHYQPTQPGAPVHAALEILQERLRDRDIRLDVDVPEDLPDVLWDSAKVSRVLHEMLDNAISFSPLDGRIELAVTRRGEDIHFTVRDEGPGIPEQHLEAVFQKFRQMGDTLTSKPSGTGIGLPICRQIALQHGGQMRAEVPSSGPGTRIRLVLPIKPPDRVLKTAQPLESPVESSVS